ncbi:hypothetical protein B4U80_02157 [Leptotrombidium deliense]|uniref:Uncharacterized protein n=1 Tax=Leptotrombidium deliense TaxID=299467 RepID=A0A443Q7F8_9ACAR|nr:hypothetical protein B4U80_02157 [Leptotrombidium deliense]
MIKISDQN